jgi:uncharacterized protein
VDSVSLAQLRRYVVSHQRYATRPRTARAADVAAAVHRLGCVQLDSISTVDRSHRLTLTSRLGRYPAGTVSRLLSKAQIFEYWAHEACVLPMDDFPLFKRRMEELKDHHWWGRKREDKKTEALVLDAIRERGALPSRAFEGQGARPGEMWNWKPAKRALEHLFAAGNVVVAGRDGFQRLYDLPERVIPQRYLDAPVPSEDAFRRGYALRAVQGRGALTESGIAEHCRFKGGVKGIRPVVDRLEAEGLVRRVAVERGRPAFPIRQPALGPRVPRARLRLPPRDRGLQARARAALRVLRAAVSLR